MTLANAPWLMEQQPASAVEPAVEQPETAAEQPEHSALLQRVFRAQLQTSRSQRNSGAPAPTESLEQRAHRLAAQLSPAERGVQWPIHVAELEPQWNEGEEGV